MTTQRKVVKTYTPTSQQGSLGTGYWGRPVIQVDFIQSDSFIMLMDDRPNKQDEQPVSGPHPHAGFETVSLLLEGTIENEAHQMKTRLNQVYRRGKVEHLATVGAAQRILWSGTSRYLR